MAEATEARRLYFTEDGLVVTDSNNCVLYAENVTKSGEVPVGYFLTNETPEHCSFDAYVRKRATLEAGTSSWVRPNPKLHHPERIDRVVQIDSVETCNVDDFHEAVYLQEMVYKDRRLDEVIDYVRGDLDLPSRKLPKDDGPAGRPRKVASMGTRAFLRVERKKTM